MNRATENNKAKSHQSRNFIMLVVIVLVCMVVFVWFLSRNTQDNTKLVEKLSFSDPLKHADPESVVLEKVQKGVEDNLKQTDELKKQVQDGVSLQNEKSDAKQKELEERLASLEKKLESNPAGNIQSNALSGGAQSFADRAPGYPNDQDSTGNQVIDDSMREDRLTLTSNDDVIKRPAKNPDTYVPANTTAVAVMLSGADASAAVSSPHNPNPMIFRITDNGTLPNHKKSHLKDCKLTGYVSGDISSERGEMELYRLSCVLPNGQIIDPKVEGWIFGKDGKFGIRGRPVWRDGAITQRIFTAGFLSGVANGVSNSYNTNSISAEGTVQTLNSAKIVQNGLANGGAKSMEKLSDYYIQRAEQYHPVIQISPGDVVDVVFKEGFYLDEKKHDHDDDETKPVSNMFDTSATIPTTQTAFQSPDANMLPLSADQVKRIEQNSKQLGLRVRENANS